MLSTTVLGEGLRNWMWKTAACRCRKARLSGTVCGGQAIGHRRLMALWGSAELVGELKMEEAAAMGEQAQGREGRPGHREAEGAQASVERRAAAREGGPTLLRAIWKMDSGERPCSSGRRS